MARVTGIGGVFLKCRGDKDALAAWYREHLGLPLESWGGAVLRWPEDRAEDGGLTVWSLADKDSQWFSPSDSAFMINYRVDDLDAVLAALRDEGCTVDTKIEDSEFGRFGWVMDPEGNRVELWQPPAGPLPG